TGPACPVGAGDPRACAKVLSLTSWQRPGPSAMLAFMEPSTTTVTGTSSAGGRAAFADWLAEPEDRGAELIDGRIVYKAEPSAEHGRIQLALGSILRGPYDRKAGAGGPGGWWIATEVDVVIKGDGVRP